MKEKTLITRLSMLVTDVLDAFHQEQKPGIRNHPEKGKPISRIRRKDFSYYMPLIDEQTKEMVGHLADISDGGFKLDARKPIPDNQHFHFRLNVPNEVADKSFMVVGARSRWCKVDPLDPYTYNVGFQLTQMSVEDLDIFNRMMECYAGYCEKKSVDLRRSNKW